MRGGIATLLTKHGVHLEGDIMQTSLEAKKAEEAYIANKKQKKTHTYIYIYIYILKYTKNVF